MAQNDICAVILAGGQSSRMGFNKALIRIDGRPLISLLVEQVRHVTPCILISSNEEMPYQFLDCPVVPDQYSGCGPLAGVHAAMHHRESSLYIVLACDLPNLRAPLLVNLVALADGYDAAIPRTNDGLAHPLCAVYRRTCLPIIERALKRGSNKFIESFLDESLSVRWVGPGEGVYEPSDLANINTPEDLRILHQRGRDQSF